MMTIEEILKNAIDGKLKAEDAPAVEALLARYPYFSLPAAALVRDCGRELQGDITKRLTQYVALASSDASAVYMLLDGENASHAGFYPDEEQKRVSTENAIDTFLSTYGSISPQEEELLNRLIFNPAPDYAQILAAEEQENLPDLSHPTGDSEQDRLNEFIIKQKQAAGQVPGGVTPDPIARQVAERHNPDVQQPEEAADNSLLSESLAKIFVKQKHYERAYEIISHLSLNYPEKSVYFADQLRFLRKLIINSRKGAKN